MEILFLFLLFHLENGMESDWSDLYNFCLYCYATFVTSQVLQPKSVNKQ